MKNAKKALSLLISAAALVSMVSCGEAVTSKGNTLVSYTDNKGNKIDYTTNDLLINHLDKDTTASVEEYYNIAYDAKVRKYFSNEKDPDIKAARETIERDADNEIKKKKDQAENTANTNKTKFEDEWKAILNSELSNLRENKRTEKALREKYETAKMRDKIADIFYDEFKSWEKKEIDPKDDEKKFNIFWGDNGYLKTRLPYHVKHILVKVDAADGELYNGHISSKDATDLYDVINLLAKGELPFGKIAELKSEDSSNTSFGNLGIMDTATSYVNEFKLNAYIYDTLFNPKHSDADAAKFNLEGDSKTYLQNLGVAEIPYEAVVRLNEFANIEENDKHQKVNDGNEDYFPRNIMFNKYFNNHNFAFITDKKSEVTAKIEDSTGTYSNLDNTSITKKDSTEGDNKFYYTDLNEETKWTTSQDVYTEEGVTFGGFKPVTINGYTDPKNVLCDENGNPILVARAGTSEYQGIHFIVIERSALDQKVTYTQPDNFKIDGKAATYSYESTLEEYYAAINPLQISGERNKSFPSFTAKTTDDGKTHELSQKTYINNINTSYSDYNQRVDTLKNTIKNFDPSYDKKVYQWLTSLDDKADNIVVKVKQGEKVLEFNITDKINKYVNREIAENKEGTFKISEDTWEGYVDFLKNQQAERATKLIPESCALGYVEGKGYQTICKYTKDSNK